MYAQVNNTNNTQAFLADYQRRTCSMSVKKLQLQSFLVTFVMT